MHYGLTSTSFLSIASDAQQGSRYAKFFLRLACCTTATASNLVTSRSGQLILSTNQLEHLKTVDKVYIPFIEGLNINLDKLSTLIIAAVDVHTPEGDTATLQLPKQNISEQTLFTTPVWLGDLGCGQYGPSVRYGDVVLAWRGAGLPLSQLFAIVSIIDPDNGTALMYESHILGGIALKGSNSSRQTTQVELISPHEWFSLAQFGSVVRTIPSQQDCERLSHALLSHDYSAFNDNKAYLFVADVITGPNTKIRREFSRSVYQAPFNAPIFTPAKDCKQYLEVIPEGTHLRVIGKIHLSAEGQYGGKLDTNLHIHGISPAVIQIIDDVSPEELMHDREVFDGVNNKINTLSEKLYCGHLKTESQECSFQAIEKIHAIQALSNVIEISKTGTPAHDVGKGYPIKLKQYFMFWQQAISDKKISEISNNNTPLV